jgi:hypothetical protein
MPLIEPNTPFTVVRLVALHPEDAYCPIHQRMIGRLFRLQNIRPSYRFTEFSQAEGHLVSPPFTSVSFYAAKFAPLTDCPSMPVVERGAE